MKKFFELVEIQTKVASIFPYVIGNLFAYYRFDTWSAKHALILLISLLSIDMATTALNNFMDHKRAIKKEGYNFEEHNAIVKHEMKKEHVLQTIFVLLVIGVVFGCILVYMTDWIVLLVGAISFAVGVLYSYGPLAISRTPFGEIFSGLFMGFGIVFISVYSQIYGLDIIELQITSNTFMMAFQYVELIIIFVYSLPLTLCISNIMLANNICDMVDDLENKRYTLPIFIGRENGFRIYFLSLMMSLCVAPILVISQILPWYHLFTLLVFIPIFKMYGEFKKNPSKEETFVTAVKSFVLISLSLILSLVVSIIL